MEFPKAKQNQNKPITNLLILFIPGLSDQINRRKDINIRTIQLQAKL